MSHRKKIPVFRISLVYAETLSAGNHAKKNISFLRLNDKHEGVPFVLENTSLQRQENIYIRHVQTAKIKNRDFQLVPQGPIMFKTNDVVI